MTPKPNGKTRMKVRTFTRSEERERRPAPAREPRRAAKLRMGLNLWAVPGRLSWDEALAEAAHAEFDGVEPNLEKDGWITPEMTSQELRARGDAARQAGLEIISLSSGLLWGKSLTAGEATERRQARELVIRQMQVAAELGTDAILVVPGAVDVFFMPERPRVRYDLAMKRLLDALDDLVPVAEREGVTIALETVWNRFLLSPIEFKLLLDRFDSERLAAYLDVGNLQLYAYPQDWIDILGKRIARVHAKGFRRAGGAGTDAGFCGLLEGDIEWPEIVAALGRAGYHGWMTAEMFRPGRMPPHLFLSEVAAELRWITSLEGARS